MDVFACSELTFTHFVCPVAKFIYEKVEEQSGNNERSKKTDKVPFFFPPLTLYSFEKTARVAKRRHKKKNLDANWKEENVSRHRNQQESQKQLHYSGTRSMSLFCSFSVGRLITPRKGMWRKNIKKELQWTKTFGFPECKEEMCDSIRLPHFPTLQQIDEVRRNSL